MDGDPKARIATEEAKQSAAERAQYADSKAASGSDSASVNASDGTAGSVPAWDFEPVMEPVAADVSPSQQQHQHSSRCPHGKFLFPCLVGCLCLMALVSLYSASERIPCAALLSMCKKRKHRT